MEGKRKLDLKALHVQRKREREREGRRIMKWHVSRWTLEYERPVLVIAK